MEDAGSSNKKRVLDESEESPEAKRLRASLLLDILEDVDSVDRNPATGDLATVMKSFEEEIASLPKGEEDITSLPVPSTSGSGGLPQAELGYLLEASDDELGLPPTVVLSSSDEGNAADDVGSDAGTGGFGQIWGFDEDIPICYDSLEFGDFGYGDDKVGGDEGVVFDGGLFDYPDVLSAPSDFSDFSWQQASLPAV